MHIGYIYAAAGGLLQLDVTVISDAGDGDPLTNTLVTPNHPCLARTGSRVCVCSWPSAGNRSLVVLPTRPLATVVLVQGARHFYVAALRPVFARTVLAYYS